VDCDTKGFTELIVNTNILGTNIHGLELAPPAVIIYATIPEGPAAFLGFIFFMLFWIMSSISATSVYCFSSSISIPPPGFIVEGWTTLHFLTKRSAFKEKLSLEG